MSKKPRYPRKLRHTLEKVAEARDERQSEAKYAKDFDPFKLLWDQFMPKQSVHTMYARFDQDHGRMINTSYMHERYEHSVIDVFPPWLSNPNTDGAS